MTILKSLIQNGKIIVSGDSKITSAQGIIDISYRPISQALVSIPRFNYSFIHSLEGKYGHKVKRL